MDTELARRLRALRDASGRSLRELAKPLRVSSSALSRYLTGQVVPPWPVVVALCKLVDTDPRPLRALWEQSEKTPAEPAEARPARNDLPADVGGFTGRQNELATLLEPSQSTRVFAIDGMAGVGKTALAIHAAHRLSATYTDGQHYVDLHGFTPGWAPIDPAEALRILLTALGVPVSRIPNDIDERAALWRAELARRRCVVVLDNAADAAQVRPLLPGAGACLVLVTSRLRLVELDGVRPLSLEVPPPGEAAELFKAAVGDARAESAAVDDVLGRCGRLPLALRVAAARLRHRPTWSVEELVTWLGEVDLPISHIFARSVEQLDPDRQRMFRLIGQVPGTDIDTHAAAALAGVPPTEARALLDGLVDENLVQEPAPDRFQQHDLLREYARTLADTATDEPSAGMSRLIDHYVRTTSAAIDRLFPFTVGIRPAVPSGGLRPVTFESPAEATVWLESERANLIATGLHAADRGRHQQAGRLADHLYRYLASFAYFDEAIVLLTRVERAGRLAGDRLVEARALRDLGWIHREQGRDPEAYDASSRAMELFRSAGGDPYGEALAASNLGYVHLRSEEYESALRRFTETLELSRMAGAEPGVASALLALAEVYEKQGEWEPARDHLFQALALYRGLGSPGGVATVQVALGLVERRLGRFDTARDRLREAVDLYHTNGFRVRVPHALNGLAEVSRAAGRIDDAVDEHTQALAVAAELGVEVEKARANLGLAQAYHRLGRTELSREHAERAVRQYGALELPEVAEARAILVAATANPDRPAPGV